MEAMLGWPCGMDEGGREYAYFLVWKFLLENSH
jgi:hypothetical protein